MPSKGSPCGLRDEKHFQKVRQLELCTCSLAVGKAETISQVWHPWVTEPVIPGSERENCILDRSIKVQPCEMRDSTLGLEPSH